MTRCTKSPVKKQSSKSNSKDAKVAARKGSNLFQSAFPRARTDGKGKKRKSVDGSVPELFGHTYAKSYDREKPSASLSTEPTVAVSSWPSSVVLDGKLDLNGVELPCPPPLVQNLKRLKTEGEEDAGIAEKFDMSGPLPAPPPPMLSTPLKIMPLPGALESPFAITPDSTPTKNGDGSKKKSKKKSSTPKSSKTVSTSTLDHPANDEIAKLKSYHNSVSSGFSLVLLVNCLYISFTRWTVT